MHFSDTTSGKEQALIPKLKLDGVQLGADVTSMSNATSLLAAIDGAQAMAARGMRVEPLLNAFAGNFQQLTKSEMGSQSFRGNVKNRLQHSIALIKTLARKLKSTGPGVVADWAAANWATLAAQLARDGIQVDAAAIGNALSTYSTPSDTNANVLIDGLLRPILNHLR